jgi:hypothetical protein
MHVTNNLSLVIAVREYCNRSIDLYYKEFIHILRTKRMAAQQASSTQRDHDDIDRYQDRVPVSLWLDRADDWADDSVDGVKRLDVTM